MHRFESGFRSPSTTALPRAIASLLLLTAAATEVACAQKAGPANQNGAEQPPDDALAPAKAADPAPSAPATTDGANGNVGEQFEAFVRERNACTAPSECVLVSPGCPLGCGTGVRQEHAEAVTKKAQELIARAEKEGGQCTYKCAYLEVACLEGHCTAVQATPKAP